ncbi:Fcf2 pre-rRNA processing family protein [Babesia bovis T2Bo]|uniref:Fcf2 pre-rRNA processing C-terminal domain-containing protein n=1 Tax=Babesia bovis TaxID=5865 RepID=A7AX74_BABBO|nr:Fcf2 pre-rRNA processing family protein [Babesia bovis T2Bo]EDO05147.1 Fcf2 pre-rRNA processing family protein [Babesia bovis T2Bo]|eukprot:XP_001608715.1 hypothetical protein [Babesia bovis T2Bo]
MENTGDASIIQYAGIFSSKVRKHLANTDEDKLDINLDVEDELENTNALDFEEPKSDGKTKGEIMKELEAKWDPLKEREPTQQHEREWRAIQLRGYVNPKKFYKGDKPGRLEPLPKKYQVGVMTSSSGVKVGAGEESQAAGAVNSRKRRKGMSVLSETLASDLSWTRKKYREIQEQKTSGSKGWYSRQMKKLKKRKL